MRFFSNENRESNDEPSAVDVQNRAEQVNPDQAHDDHAERVQSDPVAVPQQRSGSPWSDAPGDASADDTRADETARTDADATDTTDDTADAELADQERTDGSEEPGYVRDRRDEFSATDTAVTDGDHDAHDHGGGRHDSVDLPLDDTADDRSDDSYVSTSDASDETGEPTRTTYGPDGTVVTTPNGASRGEEGEQALKDEGGFDDPTAVDPETDKPLDSSDTAVDDADNTVTDTDGEQALKDEGEFDDPTAVDPATDKPLDGEETAAATDSSVTPVATVDGASSEDASAPVVPIPVPVGSDNSDRTGTAAAAVAAPAGDKLPGSVAEPDLTSIFGKDDANSFQERWRDVQLRFVDSPKEATTEAASLLDEAVEKLAASLRAQKDTLHNVDSDDTEQLRIELRGYREILVRIIGL